MAMGEVAGATDEPLLSSVPDAVLANHGMQCSGAAGSGVCQPILLAPREAVSSLTVLWREQLKR